MKKFTLTGFLCLILAGVFAAQDIYLSPTGDDLNAGTQASPYATLAKATSMVSEDGAVIHVAAGTYVFTQTAIIKPFNQTIVGEDAANTIFDGNNSVALIDGVTEMQLSEKTLTINKITFKNGKINVVAETGGAAIKMWMKTNLTVEDCYFYNNVSESTTGIFSYGGAIYFCGNNITVNRCFFDQNASKSTGLESYGGALTVRHLFNTDIPFSATHLPAGPTNAVIKNSTFYKNHSKSKGGAVYFNKQLDTRLDDDDATFAIQNCVFLENTGGKNLQLGAAVALSSGSNSTNNKEQTIIMTNNTLCNNYMMDATNTATQKNTVLLEGFRYTSYMANNLITCSVIATGEGLYANQPAPVEYGKNNIIDKINANINGADFTTNAVSQNNVLVAVNPDALSLSTSLTGYPLGTTFSVPYLTVTSGSPAINGGANSYLVNTIANPAPADPAEYVLQSDIMATAIQGASRDIGAFEYTPSTSTKSEITEKYIIINEESGVRVLNVNVNDRVDVYNINGVLIQRMSIRDSQSFIPLSASGIYIISVNGKARKHYFKK